MIPFPAKKYNVIYVDPPWGYQNKATRAAADKHYGTMTIDELKQMPVGHGGGCLAADDCALFLWATFWGLGNWTRSNSEICLLAIKGKPKRVSAAVHSVVMTPVQRHSQKPDEVRERIVKLVGDVPRIELFARQSAPGWDCWGNEAPQSNSEN